MAAVGEFMERRERPAYVRFERKAEEDVAASRKAGQYVGRDVEYALTTPPYSKDVVVQEISIWKSTMDENVRNARFPAEWRDANMKQYQAWKNGLELPPNGTAIRGWNVISPAQQEMLIRINILTVEDLAGVNDEGARRIGMGSLDLKTKAKAWLSQLNDKGPLTMEIASVKNENAQLRASLVSLQEQVNKLLAAQGPAQMQAFATPTIVADDILPEAEDRQTRKK